MKRIISAILCVLMLASVAVFAVSADEATIVGQTATTKDFVVFDFTVAGQTGTGNNSADAGNALWWGKAKRFDSEYIAADACTRLKFTGDESQAASYMTACIPTSLQFDPTEFKIAKICYRLNPDLVEDDAYTAKFYFGKSELDPDDEGEVYYKGQWGPETFVNCDEFYVSDNEWHDLYVDMTDNVYWDDLEYGFVSEFRLDFLTGAELFGAYMDVKYIAILKTEEDAQRFGIDELGKFALLELPETTAAEETTVEEVTTVADETTAAEVATTVAEAATTAAEAATTVATSATTAAEETTTAAAASKSGCGSTVGIVSIVAILGMGLVSFKKKN